MCGSLRAHHPCHFPVFIALPALTAPRLGRAIVWPTGGQCADGMAGTHRYRPFDVRLPQYVPSNAKIGLRCFHSPAVKSGNSNVWKLLAIDCSDSGVIALQVTAS